MKRFSLLLAILLTVFLYANSHATVMVKCFTGEFVRGTGKPVIESLTFPGNNGQATIKLFNGGPQGSLAKRVSSATVRVNGMIVFGPSSFNQNVGFLEAPITLKQGSNSLQVLLNGKPGGKIQIEIVQAAEVNYSGTYCLIIQQSDGQSSDEIMINQNGSDVTFTLNGSVHLEGSGILDGNTMTLTSPNPEGGQVKVVITFAEDGQTFSGTFVLDLTPLEQGLLMGTKGSCTVYVYPDGDPFCILPVENISLVTAGQQYNSEGGGAIHKGLDFKLESPLPNIIAPCDGVIAAINQITSFSMDNIILGVWIQYNSKWRILIAFEPYSPDPVIAQQQKDQIAVSLNQIMRKGDLLGKLFVPAPLTEFPHIHWGIRNTISGEYVCPRDYAVPEAQVQLDALYGGFGLSPVCLP